MASLEVDSGDVASRTLGVIPQAGHDESPLTQAMDRPSLRGRTHEVNTTSGPPDPVGTFAGHGARHRVRGTQPGTCRQLTAPRAGAARSSGPLVVTLNADPLEVSSVPKVMAEVQLDAGVLARVDAVAAASGSSCLLYTSPSPRDGLL